MNKTIFGIIVGIIAVGGGAFYGGMKYAQSGSPVGGRGNFAGLQNLSAEERQQRLQEFGANAGGARLRQGFGGQGGFSGGEVISKDDKSITIKLQDGGSRIIFYSDTTEVSKSEKGSINDVSSGAQITVQGSQNSDGSITAQTIQLR